MKRWIRSLFVTPLIFLVALYTLLEDFLESIVKPVVEHISSWQILRTVEGFLQKRSPYTLFAIYTCKLILFSSIKLLSLYWISQGRGFGAPLLVSGELCGAALTVWYAKVALPALLTLRWFAKAYGKFITVKNRLISKLQQMPAYRYARSKVQSIRRIIRELKVVIVRRRILGKGDSWGISRVKAVYRLLSRKR